jgi:hypothetical protein
MEIKADGSGEQQHDYDKDSLDPKDVKKRVPSEKEEEFVKLNRGGNLADRAIQGIQDMPADFKDRMKDEAGADAVKDAEAKAKKVEETKPALAPPARLAPLKEGIVLTARYGTRTQRKVTAFNTKNAILAESVSPKFTLLETKGLGNDRTEGAKTIIESHNFYIDLEQNQIYMQEKKAGALNEGVLEVAQTDYDRLRNLITYSPSQWTGSR